ncbi:MAG: hemolysin family protein [Nanobdellota archaeon]
MIGTVLILIALIVLSGVFSSTEIAIFSISDIKLRYYMKRGNSSARLLDKLKRDSHKLLITILIGNNIVNIASASVATKLALDLFGNVGVAYATGAMTLLILVVGEISPKAFATKNARKIAFAMARPLNMLKYLLYPFVYIFDKFTTLIIPASTSFAPSLTEEEVRDIVALSKEQGSIKMREEKMIQNIFKLDDTSVEDIMTPRPDVLAFEHSKRVSEVIDTIKEKGYSRIPVFEKDMDNIIGILYAKDLLIVSDHQILGDIIRPAFFIPETKPIDSLLMDFKQKQVHIAIVVNEHGTMTGIVTIEDLLEEIVGEIYDETDTGEQVTKNARKVSDTEFIFKGRCELKEASYYLDTPLVDSGSSTISGFIMNSLKRLPFEGEIVKISSLKFEIKKIKHHRIDRVIVTKLIY